jgi:hypothetical protein
MNYQIQKYLIRKIFSRFLLHLFFITFVLTTYEVYAQCDYSYDIEIVNITESEKSLIYELYFGVDWSNSRLMWKVAPSIKITDQGDTYIDLKFLPNSNKWHNQIVISTSVAGGKSVVGQNNNNVLPFGLQVIDAKGNEYKNLLSEKITLKYKPITHLNIKAGSINKQLITDKFQAKYFRGNFSANGKEYILTDFKWIPYPRRNGKKRLGSYLLRAETVELCESLNNSTLNNNQKCILVVDEINISLTVEKESLLTSKAKKQAITNLCSKILMLSQPLLNQTLDEKQKKTFNIYFEQTFGPQVKVNLTNIMHNSQGSQAKAEASLVLSEDRKRSIVQKITEICHQSDEVLIMISDGIKMRKHGWYGIVKSQVIKIASTPKTGDSEPMTIAVETGCDNQMNTLLSPALKGSDSDEIIAAKKRLMVTPPSSKSQRFIEMLQTAPTVIGKTGMRRPHLIMFISTEWGFDERMSKLEQLTVSSSELYKQIRGMSIVYILQNPQDSNPSFDDALNKITDSNKNITKQTLKLPRSDSDHIKMLQISTALNQIISQVSNTPETTQ